MMPNIVRGKRPVGLMTYLVGPGRTNEHEEPHLVGGDDTLTAWIGHDELDRATAATLGRQLEAPAKVFGVEIKAGHVWHCSLSLRDTEGPLTDEQWEEIAREFVTEMGFTAHPGDEHTAERAACPWLALRHGVSAGGNDHIHVVVGLVREDGTRANVWRDRPRAQQVCGDLERKYGLEVLESRQQDRGTRGHHAAEEHAAARQGRAEPATATLARIVRASATASDNEASFVRRLRQEGLWVRPRFAAGRNDVVVGYSVALAPERGERPVWFGGGRVGRDLSLTRLRASWTSTPEGASEAVREWIGRGGQDRAPGTQERVTPAMWQDANREIAALRERMAGVDPANQTEWASTAREAAGVLAAWSLRVERSPGPLARAAEVVARSAQTRARTEVPRPNVAAQHLRGAARVMRVAAAGGQGIVAETLLFRQIVQTLRSLHDAHHANGEAQRAADLARMARDELRRVEAQLPQSPEHSEAGAALDLARAGQEHPSAGTELPTAPSLPGTPGTQPPPQQSPNNNPPTR